jgi:exopolyphosphatase/guanosine-5'-triphosphate,3'-diphosphate pyrophosphatase
VHLSSALAQGEFCWRAPCLRLALIKCHARGAIDPRALRLQRDGDSGLLGFSPAWAANNPRTLHLLRKEAEAWSKQGPLRLLLPG